MGKLDQYFEQAKALEGERRDALLAFFESFFTPDDWELSPEQEEDLAKRLADPKPDFIEMSVEEAMFAERSKR